MKTIERIKLYCKNPKCIAYDIKDWKDSLTLKFYHKLKEMLYKFENKTYYNINITQHYKNNQYQEYYFLDKTVTFARLNPVITVMREIDLYFDKRFGNIRIPKIDVDTQNEEEITVTIHTMRPGYLIGKGGQTIDYFEKRLSELFAKKTKIKIVEVKKDINEPIYIGY